MCTTSSPGMKCPKQQSPNPRSSQKNPRPNQEAVFSIMSLLIQSPQRKLRSSSQKGRKAESKAFCSQGRRLFTYSNVSTYVSCAVPPMDTRPRHVPPDPAGPWQSQAQATMTRQDAVRSAVKSTRQPGLSCPLGSVPQPRSTYQGPGAALTLQGQAHVNLMAASPSARYASHYTDEKAAAQHRGAQERAQDRTQAA